MGASFLAFEVLHHEEGLAVVVVDFKDGAYVGVVEGRGCLSFALEAFASFAVAGFVGGD